MTTLRGLWPRGGLWRHADFLKLWSAQTVSQFGTAVSQVALPLVAVLSLHASAFQVAALGTVEFLPFLLFTLPAGVWVDRLPRRPILVLADAGRAAALGSIPLVAAVGHLTLAQLYVAGFVTGTLTVFFDVAYQSYLPSIVERDRLVDGNAKLEVSRSAAQIGGPGLGGLLVRLFTAPYAVLADAASYVWSSLFVFWIRRPEVVPERTAESPSLIRELIDGVKYLLGHRYWRWISMSTATFNFFNNVAFAILIVYLVRRLDMSPLTIGITFSLASAGSLVAAFFAGKIGTRLGIGRTILLGTMIDAVPLVLVPLAPKSLAIPFVAIAFAVVEFGVVLYNVSVISLTKSLTGSNAAAGLVFFALSLPSLFSPLAGLVVDRVRRRPLLVVTYLTEAVVVLALLFVHSRSDVWILYAVTGYYGAAGTVAASARSALMTTTLPQELLGEANGIFQSVREGLRLIAPLLGAGIFASAGGGAVAILDAASFIGVVIALLFMRMPEPRFERVEHNFWAEVMAGARHIFSTLPLRQIVFATGVCLLVVGFSEPVVFAVLDQGLHPPPSFFGVLSSFQGVGAIIGGFSAPRLLRPP